VWRGGSCSFPALGAASPARHAQQRRLAGTVRPRDEQEAAVGNVDVEPGEHATVAVALRERASLDHER